MEIEIEIETEMSFRQKIENEICNLNNDFRLLWFLRHHHNLKEPLLRIIKRQRAMNNLLKFYPKKICLNCNHPLN